MGLELGVDGSEARFAAYVAAITSALGHADRAGRVRAAHQSLHHVVAKSDWSDDAVLAAVRARVLPIIAHRGPIRALIIDDTGIPKKGTHAVGVARQDCG